MLRLQLHADRSTPTTNLLEQSNSLSVHQLGAYSILNQVYSIHRSQKPDYHFKRLFPDVDEGVGTRSSLISNARIDFNLSLGRGSFFYQAVRLWRSIPAEMRNSSSKSKFKKMCWNWVKSNIEVRP